MTAIERAWAMGWSIDAGIVNPVGQVVEREIKRWNKQGRRDDGYRTLIADLESAE